MATTGFQGSQDASQGYAGSSLDVIVECAIFLAVLFKQAECIVLAKVFKLSESILSIEGDNCLHEFINKLIIFVPSSPGLPQPDIILRFSKFLSVCSNIQHN